MFDKINAELQLLAQEVYDAAVQVMYEEYIDELLSDDLLLMYATNSYDCDCIFYGMK